MKITRINSTLRENIIYLSTKYLLSVLKSWAKESFYRKADSSLIEYMATQMLAFRLLSHCRNPTNFL